MLFSRHPIHSFVWCKPRSQCMRRNHIHNKGNLVQLMNVAPEWLDSWYSCDYCPLSNFFSFVHGCVVVLCQYRPVSCKSAAQCSRLFRSVYRKKTCYYLASVSGRGKHKGVVWKNNSFCQDTYNWIATVIRVMMEVVLVCVFRTCDLVCEKGGMLQSHCSEVTFWGADEAWQDWQQWESSSLTATNKNVRFIFFCLYPCRLCIHTFTCSYICYITDGLKTL